jgi:asparagine synthase (glutamine-hydrolysing)
MCGLAGIVHFDGKAVDASALRLMTDIARHRGPDDQGFRLFSLREGVSAEFHPHGRAPEGSFSGGVGFNRLSILDLSPRGHQPMANPAGTIFIAFNGEVYNAFDHRPALEAKGYQFRSTTDTEVILYLYEEYGIEGCLERLNGMFAFTIVDLRTREMHIARDHLGIKPMYYAQHQGALLFASESKSITAYPGFPRELAPDMLDEQLLFRYNAGEGFLVKGIKQLRPGFRLHADASGKVTIHQHYTIPDVEPEAMTDEEAMERFEAVFEKSVRSQLISDVKLGCQLSGGIDSSLVTSIARDRFEQDLDAFSIIFEDNAVSEEKWMRIAAEKTRTIDHCYPLTFDYFLENLRDATWHYDYPLNLGNAVGLYLLAQEARKHVTVLLSGDGADELMGGYPRFFLAALRPSVMPLLPFMRSIPAIGPKLVRNFDVPPGLDEEGWFIKFSSSMRDQQVLALRPDADLQTPLERRRELFREGKSSFLDNCCKFDMQTFMVELLIRQDKMMMAHSVENRVPFLDREVVELARRVPLRLRVSDRVLRPNAMEAGTKVLLKKMAEKRFGYEFVHRRKLGFGLPLLDYFRDPKFETLLNDSLIPGITRRGWIDAKTVRQWHARIRDHRDVWLTEAMWSVVSMEIWAQECLDKAPTLR